MRQRHHSANLLLPYKCPSHQVASTQYYLSLLPAPYHTLYYCLLLPKQSSHHSSNCRSTIISMILVTVMKNKHARFCAHSQVAVVDVIDMCTLVTRMSTIIQWLPTPFIAKLQHLINIDLVLRSILSHNQYSLSKHIGSQVCNSNVYQSALY